MNDAFDHSHLDQDEEDPLAWATEDTVGAAAGLFLFLFGLVVGILIGRHL